MIPARRSFLPKQIAVLLSAAFLGVAFSLPVFADDPLFSATFEEDQLSAFPQSDWTSASSGSNYGKGAVEVRQDVNDWFGQGTSAKYLRVRDGGDFTLRGELDSPREVVVMRLSFIGRNTSNDSRWVHFNFLAGDGTQRAHIFSLRLTEQTIRAMEVPYGNNDELIEFSVVMNNSESFVSYIDPEGEERVLPSTRADVWANGELKAQHSSFARAAGGAGPIRAVSIQADSAAVVSFDLADLQVFDGAVVNAETVTPPPPPMVSIGDDGRLDYSADVQGNRIPDFSNAGYMGGGVPIPDVPTEVTLYPQSGDDRSRIQAAIDQVSNMPMDETGFRGAVLLKAGEYHVSNTLHIGTSGVVLRGEGDGSSGTILHATASFQHNLIEVFGTGEKWVEVSGTRRDVTDTYVPVGAKSFHVTDAGPYEIGDTIIVYRPSTEEWISALGMDEIPERSDGLPVTQWTAGSRDIQYDRVITAIDGNKITIDAPLANALEAEYGGGYVFRYTFPGRISQVGIENIRAVSAYDGGSWHTGQDDEDHAWSFVVLNRVQNAWIRDTTALHFGFGNTYVESYGKWITVQDSQNLYPVSTISGSRRYPFYIRGQLNLVQRCYANYARHDYGTSSLTHGPNVFLNSSGDHSYSDTGPHHRWATGTLYDNIHVPNRDIAIQNRLNYGSGHGWAGANHVVWNSSADRIVVQNPPTAQNWAIGVTGTKWEGAFPTYAEDGYWVSHGTRVDPDSLYLKQLEDRLDPEGIGGAISTVSFSGETAAEAQPGESLRFSVSRLGNRDGPANVQFVLEGEGADLIEAPDEVKIPAHYSGVLFDLQLRDEATLLDERAVTIKLIHGAGYSIGGQDTAKITIPPSPLGEWRAEHFSEEQRADSTISGPRADPAGDGVENLLKYALDLSPFKPVAAESLPAMNVVDGRLTLAFARGDSRSDIRYVVEVSSDLKNWESGAEFTEELNASADGDWEQVTVADRTPLSGSERRFIRLRIEQRE